MSTTKEILDEARTVIVALDTTRGPVGRKFTQHPRTSPFAIPPSGTPSDNFHVQAAGQVTTQAFGRVGTKLDVLTLQVLLGHGPYSGRETDREDFAHRDAERIRDVLEMRTWAATVEACFFQGLTVDRGNFDWWITTLTFSVHFTGTIATS